MRGWVVAGLLVASTARADDVGVVVSGEATLQPQLAAGVEAWLHDHGRTVVASSLDPEATTKLIDCFVIEDMSCARGVVDQKSHAGSVVYANVDVSARADGSRDFAIVGYWFAKGHEPVGDRRTCSQCTEQGMLETLGTLLGSLAVDPPPAPVPAPVQPARVPNVRAPMSVERPSHAIPLAAIGVGAAALIAGGVLIAIDQDPPPLTGEQPPTYRDTATGGTVLAIAGAAAIGTGMYLWLHGSSSRPVAMASPGGGYIGWAGSF